MDYSNRKFVIISSDEINSVDFSLVLETSIDTLRYNNDNTKTFIKWESDSNPSFISDIKNSEGVYSSDEMNDILATSEWS